MLGREHRHESANTIPIRAHIHVHPGRQGGHPAHITKVAAIGAKVQVTVAGRTQRAEEAIAVELAAQAWTKVELPNTEDHWVRKMATGMRREDTAARISSKRMETGAGLRGLGRLVRRGGYRGENEVSAHTAKD